MRRIILNLAVSLDGFIEGPGGETDWCVPDESEGKANAEAHFDQFLAGIDTIFYGRVSYDRWGQYQPDASASLPEKKLWQAVHSKTKYVFSKNRNRTDNRATYITASLTEAVHDIKNKPGKDIWLYGGANLIATFIHHQLIDQYLLAVHPVLLGGGKPLFTNSNERTKLTLNRVVSSTAGVVLLDYDVRPR
jgi:dihydrofolate reductase